MDRIKLVHRISRVQGQLESLKNILQDDVSCDEVLRRSKTCKAALDSFSKTFLVTMMRECLLHPEHSKERREEMLIQLEETIKHL